MRLKRTQNDFRVTELLDDDSLLSDGPHAVYRITKRGLTTFEAADLVAKGAGVERSAVAYAGLKDKDGVTSQIMTVEGGKPVTFRDQSLTIRPVGRAARAVESKDSKGNSFEIVVRDLEGDDMRRIRVNMLELKRLGIPNYFDDQRFGCLRHGQGFIVRHLLKGEVEMALRALLAAPSRYGHEKVEQFKYGIQKRWGKWEELTEYCRGRRGATVFEHLKKNPEDFLGAMERGIATRERTIHLFAYQSYLWNQAAAFRIREIVGDDDVAWLPGDAASLPVWREMTEEQRDQLRAFELPLLGPGVELAPEVEALYKKVFRHEGLPMSAFLELDINGFRPQAEDRPFLVEPEYLRAAPAEDDEIYKRRRKMRVRFTLPRGHYATLVCKRLCMPTEKDYATQLRIWVARHPLEWPDDNGKVVGATDYADRRHWSERGKPSGYQSDESRERQANRGGYGRDDRGGDRRPAWQGGGHGGGNRPDARSGGWKGGGGDRPEPRKSAWQGGDRPAASGGGWNKREDRDDRGDRGGYRRDDRGGDRGGYRRDDCDNRGDRGGYRRDDRGGNRPDARSGGWKNQEGGNRPDARSGGWNKRDDRDDRGDRGDRGGYRNDRRDERSGPRKSAWQNGPRPDARSGGWSKKENEQGGENEDRGSSEDTPRVSPWNTIKKDHEKDA